jgi:hypothetical protein
MVQRPDMLASLEAEDLVVQLADGLGLFVAKALSSLLHCRNHGRGAANKNLDIASRRGKLLLDHIGRNEADAAVPLLGRVVEHVVDAELGVLGGERIEILFEQDILRVDVGEDEVHFGVVTLATAADDGLDDLQHGCDASATCDHAEVANHVGGVDHCALGALDAHCLTDLQTRDMLGDVSGGVRLDEEIKVAPVFVRGDGRVRADNFLGLAFDGGAERDVLADGEAEDVGFAGKLESVAARVSCFTPRGIVGPTWRCCGRGRSSPRAQTPGTRPA